MKTEGNEDGVVGFTKVIVKQVGSGETNVLSLNVDFHTTTVRVLKERIEKQLDIPVDRQRLIGWGRMLENAMFLRDMPGCKEKDGKVVAPAVQYVHLTPLPKGQKLSTRSSRELCPVHINRNRPTNTTSAATTSTPTSNPVAALPDLASTSAQLERARRLGLRHLRRRRRRDEPYNVGDYHPATTATRSTTSTVTGTNGASTTDLDPSRMASARRNVDTSTSDLLAAVNSFAESARNSNNTNQNVLGPLLSVAAASSLLPPGALEAVLSAGFQWVVPAPAPPPIAATTPAAHPFLTIPPQSWLTSSMGDMNVMAMNPTSHLTNPPATTHNGSATARTMGQELHPLALLAESLGIREQPPPPAPAPPLPPPAYSANSGSAATSSSDATALASLLLPYLLTPNATSNSTNSTNNSNNNSNSALATSLLTQSLLLDPTLLDRLYSNARP